MSRGRRIVKHEANDVHDFAWTAWDGFRTQKERVPGTAVSVELFYPAGNEENARRSLQALRFGLPHFERRYGRYPYPTLTVVHPPEHARNSGGMEYPTLITTGGAWYFPRLGIRAVEGVTLHELGHQWFYGLLATDEHSWPFLDEGLNSYAEGVVLEAAYGAGSLIDLPGFELSTESVRRAFAASRAEDDVIASPAARFSSFEALGSLVYSRTAVVLHTLANVYGQDALTNALARYAHRYRFLRPGPAEFIQTMGETLGEEARATLEAALFERGRVDYLVRNLASARVKRPAGVFDRPGGRETIVRDAAGDTERWAGRVVVYRHGNLTFPVDIELLAEDGTRQRRRWDGRGTWTAVDYEGPSRLVSATVDPDFRILLDDNLLNNGASTRRSGSPRVLERTTYLSELLLAVFGP